MEQTIGAESRKKKKNLYEDGWCTFQTTFVRRWTDHWRVFMVLKYTGTGNVLGIMKRFQRHFPESEDTMQTNNNGQLKQVCPVWFKFEQERKQISGRSCSETALKPSDCFQNITDFCILKKHKHPFIYWKLWWWMCTSHLLTVLLLSVPFICQFWVSLIVKHYRAVSEYLIM